MTRKDYIAIAESLRFDLQRAKLGQLSLNTAAYGIEYATEGIMNVLAADNPRFNRAHFLAVVHGERELQSRPSRAS